jgi:hypothetical protein
MRSEQVIVCTLLSFTGEVSREDGAGSQAWSLVWKQGDDIVDDHNEGREICAGPIMQPCFLERQ